MERAFDSLAYSARNFGLLNVEAKLDPAVGAMLDEEFASAGSHVLVRDTPNLSSECSPRYGEP
jgi:hypothetical protein